MALTTVRGRLSAPDVSGRLRADHFMIVSVACLRGLQLLQAALVTVFRYDQYRLWWPVALTLVVLVVWGPILFVRAHRIARVPRGWLAADVALTCAAILIVSRLSLGGEVETWTNWAFIIGCSTAMLAAIALPTRGWLAVTALLVGVGVLGAQPALAAGQASISNLLGNSATYIGLAAAAALTLRHTRRVGQDLDDATARAAATDLARAAEKARYDDRLTQYRTLHDTVLSTLTAIARGGLDPHTEAVRTRAGREADYLRRLLMGEVAAREQTLHDALSEVVEDMTALGLRTHYLADALPVALPASAVQALSEAIREAMTNVVRHSGTHQAWLTATGEAGDGVIVRVADQGRGFDLDTIGVGLGLQGSIRDRVAEAGGVVVIDSRPGEGTLVELHWTPLAAAPPAMNGARS